MALGVPAGAGDNDVHRKRIRQWTEALEKMREALQILDDCDEPADAGVHLDLAINRLRDEIEAFGK